MYVLSALNGYFIYLLTISSLLILRCGGILPLRVVERTVISSGASELIHGDKNEINNVY